MGDGLQTPTISDRLVEEARRKRRDFLADCAIDVAVVLTCVAILAVLSWLASATHAHMSAIKWCDL